MATARPLRESDREIERSRRCGNRRDLLHRRSWLNFLETQITRSEDPGACLRINGQRITETQRRALHRWQHEGMTPSVYSGDRFLIGVGLHINEYFFHCEIEGLSAWSKDAGSAWHEEALSRGGTGR
jgi:hypothetical protein